MSDDAVMMGTAPRRIELELLPADSYSGQPDRNPYHLYHWPIVGRLYRRRVELCLGQCSGGERVLEVGFGSGLTFLNLDRLYDEIHGLDLDADTASTAELFRSRGITTTLRNGDVCAMPYADGMFDTVLLISILEHLRPERLDVAVREIARVLRPGGQLVYGVPIERPLMVFAFRMLGYDIRQHHFSTHDEVAAAARRHTRELQRFRMSATPRMLGHVYEVGHFVRDTP